MTAVDIIVGLLLLASGLAVLTAALGLVRLRDYFQRMHAPAIAYTLGSWSAALASVIYFSALAQEAALRVWLVIILLSVTAPVTTLLLARAALFRRRAAGDPLPPSLGAAMTPDEPGRDAARAPQL